MVEYEKERYILSDMTREQELDLIFHALSDSTRRKILTLIKASSMRVTEIASEFQISLNAVSKHLKVLEKAQLMTRKKDGRVYHCQMNSARLQEIDFWMEQYQAFWKDGFNNLSTHLEKNTGD